MVEGENLSLKIVFKYLRGFQISILRVKHISPVTSLLCCCVSKALWK